MIVSGGLPFPGQALGETVPSLTNGYFYGHTGLELANRFATYGALYRAQPAVATVVDKVANAAARLTVRVWDTTPETGKVIDNSSAFAKLMANPSTELSPFAFWRWTVSTYEVYGEAFWLKQRDSNGKVVNLLPMHPSRVSVHRSQDGDVEYIFTLGVASAGILRVPSTEVVPFMRYNPDSLMRGLSRLEHLRTTLLNEDAARRATSSWWNRGARPSVLLKHPSSLSQAAQERLKANFDSRHAGADNAGGTAVLEEGMDAQVVQLTAEEMQYIESRKMNLTEVCMVFDVPPPVIHILDHATFSNITEQSRMLYRDTMAPRLEDIESVIDFALRTEFYPAGERQVSFSLDEVLRGDFETRAGAVVQLIQNGVMKPSEARPLFDLDDAGKDADKLYGNAALVPLGSNVQKPPVASSAPQTPRVESEPGAGDDEASEGESEDVLSGKELTLDTTVVRSLNGRIGRKSTTREIRAALAEGHHKELAKYFDEQRAAYKTAASHKANGLLDQKTWDDKLGNLLYSMDSVTSKAIGTRTAQSLDGTFDPQIVDTQVRQNAVAAAKKINQTTSNDIEAGLDDMEDGELPDDVIDDYFDGQGDARSNQISMTRVAVIAGLTAFAVASALKAVNKTWVVTSPNARPEHANMDGETVPMSETFSNGLMYPGEYLPGEAEQVANCSCETDFSRD